MGRKYLENDLVLQRFLAEIKHEFFIANKSITITLMDFNEYFKFCSNKFSHSNFLMALLEIPEKLR